MLSLSWGEDPGYSTAENDYGDIRKSSELRPVKNTTGLKHRKDFAGAMHGERIERLDLAQ